MEFMGQCAERLRSIIILHAVTRANLLLQPQKREKIGVIVGRSKERHGDDGSNCLKARLSNDRSHFRMLYPIHLRFMSTPLIEARILLVVHRPSKTAEKMEAPSQQSARVKVSLGGQAVKACHKRGLSEERSVRYVYLL